MASLIVNERVPPGVLANNRLTNTDAWCRYDPLTCLAQVGIESTFMAAAFLTVLLLLDNDFPSMANVFKFMAVFAFVDFSAKMASDSMSDKMTIIMIGALGSKMATLLAPKVVIW